MRLDTLLEFARSKSEVGGWEEIVGLEVTGIACDSRRVEPGSLFVAIRGERFDGHAFLPEAAAAGACAAVVSEVNDAPLPQITAPDPRRLLGRLAAAFHGYPGERLFTVGVTGTNGKTTTTSLIRHLLEAGGERAGLVGTVSYRVGGREREAVHTTPESVDLQMMLASMIAEGDAAAVLEVSSHALALGRIEGLAFDVACFTNLGRDHLDFHASMDDYLDAKTRLFTEHRKPEGVAILNLDDPAGERLAGILSPPVAGVAVGRDADVRAEDIEVLSDGLRFRLLYDGGSATLRSPLLGLFNVHNLLLAAAVGRVKGMPVAAVAEALSTAPPVPGRMERLPGPEGVTVILDYAHKPEALRGALQACRELCAGRIIAVFGCGGDRDRGKRPLMGRIAALGADQTVVTSDNPRSEDPEAIIAEIVAGIPDEASLRVEADRRRAIALALEAAVGGDLVLVAGKGHERYQIVGDHRIPFDEREVVADAVAALAQAGRP